MVRFPIVRFIRLTITAGCAIVSLGSCFGPVTSPDPAAGCDGFVNAFTTLDGHAAVFAANPTTNLSNGLRTYSWSANAANLCVAAPQSQNHVDFEVDVEPGAPALTVSGSVSGAVGFQPSSTALTLATAGGINAYGGSLTSIGLTQGSTDGRHAAVTMVLSITFVSHGSDSVDLAVAQSFVDNVTIFGYFQHLN